jgi:hypothetical protein
MENTEKYLHLKKIVAMVYLKQKFPNEEWCLLGCYAVWLL